MLHTKTLVICLGIGLQLVFVSCRTRTYNSQSASVGSGIDASSSSKYTLLIDPSVASSVDEARIRRETEKAIYEFERRIAPLKEPLAVTVGAEGCLRTGYSFSKKTVQYCSNSDTPASGTASDDVIHHETFHAMSCQLKPEWCTTEFLKDDANVALQEGLADTFSHALMPDEFFGEGFYNTSPFVRRYRSDFCYNLVEGSHQKGNAISSLLTGQKYDIARYSKFFSGSEFSVSALVNGALDDCFSPNGPKLEFVAENYPASSLERFRIEREKPLVLLFKQNESFTNRFARPSIVWEPQPNLFKIEAGSSEGGMIRFNIAVTGESGWEKITALYRSGDKTIGAQSFYFTIKKPSTAPSP